MPDTPDGLDLSTLNALRPVRHNQANLLRRIEKHLDDHDGYVAFSGGKDSLTVLHLTLQVEPRIPVVFFDSGAEYPETYQFLEDIAAAWDLNLQVIAAEPPLLQVLATSGLWDHHTPPTKMSRSLHDILITEPARAAHADHGPGELWGVRADESSKGTGRWTLYHRALTNEIARSCGDCCQIPSQQRQTHGGLITRTDGTTAYGPLWNWSLNDVWSYIARNKLPINPVYNKLKTLGVPEHQQRVSHIIDGNFLEHGRVTWLKRGWPTLFEELAAVLPRLREYI